MGDDARASRPARVRHFLMVAVPLALALAAMVVGFILYAASRERYFTERYLRALATLAEQAEGAMAGSESAVDQALREWSKAAKLTAAQNEATLGRWCEATKLPAALHGPRIPATDRCLDVAPRRDVLAARAGGCDFLVRLKEQLELIPMSLSPTDPQGFDAGAHRSRGVIGTPTMHRLQQSWPVTRGSPTLIDSAPNETADASLHFCRTTPAEVRLAERDGSCGWPASSDHFCAEASMRAVLAPLVDQTALESLDLFVVDDHGTTLYERGTSGFRLASMTREPPAASNGSNGGPPATHLPSLAEVTATTVVRPVAVDGTQYQLFTQPVRLGGRGAQPYVTWAVGALVPIDRMQADARRVPMLIMSGVPLLFLVALLALPVLGLITMGRRDALTAAPPTAWRSPPSAPPC